MPFYGKKNVQCISIAKLFAKHVMVVSLVIHLDS